MAGGQSIGAAWLVARSCHVRRTRGTAAPEIAEKSPDGPDRGSGGGDQPDGDGAQGQARRLRRGAPARAAAARPAAP